MATVRPPRTGLAGALYDNTAIFGGRIRVVAFGRPYDYQEQDWTFRHLRQPGDASTDCSVTRHLPDIAKELDINEILAPTPDFGGRVCFPVHLNVTIPVGNQLVVRRGVQADGCRLMLGQTYGLSAAGCPIFVGWYPHDPATDEKVRIAAVHAGFDSLFDRQFALTGAKSREPESLTQSFLDAIGCWDKPARRRRVGGIIFFPIPPSQFCYPWDHAKFGADNHRICKYLEEKFGAVDNRRSFLPGKPEEGHIDIAELFTCQLAALGVPVHHIGLVKESDAFDDMRHIDGTPMWYTTRGPFAQRRNLLLVKRTG